MTTAQQNKAWACLPKDVRTQIKDGYNTDDDEFDRGWDAALEACFGQHNLTSDTEPEEMLYCPKKEVQGIYQTSKEIMGNKVYGSKIYSMNLQTLCVLEQLFGDKCLPDKSQEEKAIEEANKETNKAMKEKELNLCELLKGCEEEEFYCHYLRRDVKFIGFDECYGMTFKLRTYKDGVGYENLIYIEKNEKIGKSFVLYPSRVLYEKYPLDPMKAWQEWKENRKPKWWRAKDGEYYWFINPFDFQVFRAREENDKVDDKRYNAMLYFRTEEEAQQAAKDIREYLQKFHQKNSEK